jgi:hypothetical protein
MDAMREYAAFQPTEKTRRMLIQIIGSSRRTSPQRLYWKTTQTGTSEYGNSYRSLRAQREECQS